MAWFRVCLGLLFIAALGCGPSGPKMYEVTGTITFDGKPVQYGEIVFSPEDKKYSADGVQIQTDGSYRVRVKEGAHIVRIIGMKMQKSAESKREPTEDPPMESYLPEKYNAKSELRAEVNESRRIDFELKSK